MESFADHLVLGLFKLVWELGPWGQAAVVVLVAAVGVAIWRDARS
jgi:hypothetical protein